MSIFAMPTLLAIDPQPGDVVVALTGISLVFLILVLLMLIITVEGKIFDAIAAKKKAAQEAAKAAPVQSEAAPASAAAPAPVVEEGIPGAIVAAIAAAIACMSGGKYTLRAVRRAGKEQGSNWSKAGTSDVTSPF
ncbi:MAG: OadG family transporter subunit [Faecalibacterium sp.]